MKRRKVLHCYLCGGRLPGGPQLSFAVVGTEGGPQPVHPECLFRSVVGDVRHQKRVCSCYGGKDADPDAVTYRESAIAAWNYYLAHNPKK